MILGISLIWVLFCCECRELETKKIPDILDHIVAYYMPVRLVKRGGESIGPGALLPLIDAAASFISELLGIDVNIWFIYGVTLRVRRP